LRKHRLNPSKVMLLLLYGNYQFVHSGEEPGKVLVEIGPFARLIRVPNSRLKEYLEWLNHWSYISNLEFSYGKASFEITPPTRFAQVS